MSEERQHGTPCITLNCPNRVGQGMFVGDLCSPCHSYLTTMSGRYSQLYRNTMSDDAYEKRMQEMEDEFNKWWDELDEPFFSGVSREVAYEIWEAAYRRGGHRPWMSMTTTQCKCSKN